MEKHSIPGYAIGVNKNGERLYEKGFGFREMEKQQPVTMDTVFGIASITKSFTCVAIMHLQEAGLLNVNDAVTKYLSEFKTKDPEKTAKMTIRQFMSHTSSLPPLPSHLNHDRPVNNFTDYMEFIGDLNMELLGEPGETFSYSNHAYSLLGCVIERVSGQSYEAYIKEHILLPAGMHRTVIELADLEGDPDITVLYEAKKVRGEVVVYPLDGWQDHEPLEFASGYLKSTVRDMLRYAEIFRTGGCVGENRILSADSVRQMTTPCIEVEPGKSYGYGLFLTEDPDGSRVVEHSGSMDGIASLMRIIPEQGLTGIAMTNLSAVPSGAMLRSTMNAIRDIDLHATRYPSESIQLPQEALQEYAGTYRSKEGVTVEIGTYGGQLTLFTDSEYHPVRCIEEDLFITNIRDDEEIMQFLRDGSGAVIRLAYHSRQLMKQTGNDEQ
ncbi:CubicO group peptidase (beta-lactamase class C family) [Bhargavaea ullalensis]|uniref:CubicO group peptidase (Beta-lactamase class C family) n=2 Tax=Bhargavaea ullalensis TaxID=1265685 RepID=A0ABV2GCV3_9BACL